MVTSPAAPLPPSFYARDVVTVARELIGAIVVCAGGAGRIVETEAYHDSEPACHAYTGVSARTRVLFGPPGRAYVYRSYGVHALLNAVCEPEATGAAALIRALEPLDQIDAMRTRRRRDPLTDLCSGPGKLTQALAIGLHDNDTPLSGSGPVTILPGDGAAPELVIGRRIGITRAIELPWRFCAAGSRHVSRPWPTGHRATVTVVKD